MASLGAVYCQTNDETADLEMVGLDAVRCSSCGTEYATLATMLRDDTHVMEEDEDGAPCCADPGCTGRNGGTCTFPGYADNH